MLIYDDVGCGGSANSCVSERNIMSRRSTNAKTKIKNKQQEQQNIQMKNNWWMHSLAPSPIQPKVELSKNKKNSYPVSSIYFGWRFPLIISRHHNNSRKKVFLFVLSSTIIFVTSPCKTSRQPKIYRFLFMKYIHTGIYIYETCTV
jgi:hypothetical protein